MYKHAYFVGLIFVVHESTVKTMKIGPLENFPLLYYFGPSLSKYAEGYARHLRSSACLMHVLGVFRNGFEY